MTDSSFTNAVRLEVLAVAAETGRVPDAAEVAQRLGRPVDEVVGAFAALAEAHVYVLEPGDPGRLRMANPFSAVPTAFAVEARGQHYFGNCVWDALGIVSLLGGEGRVVNRCPDCGDELVLSVAGGELEPVQAVAHFAVPARHWWDDIIHT